jgi:hypothetical protein
LRFAGSTVGSKILTGTSTQGQQIQFNGFNFGQNPELYTQVRYGLNNSNVYDQVCAIVVGAGSNDTTIMCKTSPGEGCCYRFVVSALGAVSSPGTDIYKYPTAPVVSRVSGCSDNGIFTTGCPTKGGSVITVIGLNFPASSTSTNVRIGVATCIITAFSTDETTLLCILPAGVGALQSVAVNVGPLFSQDKQLLSYAQPFISTITGCPLAVGNASTNCARQGTTTITITGTNFGSSGALVLVGGIACTNVIHSSSTPHEVVTCQMPSGTGTNVIVLLLQGGGQVSSNYGSVSYLPCPAGSYPDSGSTACNLCDPGKFSGSIGDVACSSCPSGTYSNTNGSTACLSCVAGKFSSGLGATICMECSVGK